jgi:enoyl-CoA hydratase
MPRDLEEAITLANDDPDISVIILSGNGKAFCSGYDLSEYAQGSESNKFTQKMPWDPIKDYQTMWNDTQHFMSIWKSLKPVICKVHGFAIAGGSDIALCSDMIIMADNAEIGYMPSRVWGTPTTAMWVHRIGPEKAKKMLFTGDKINGKEAEKIGLVLESVSPEKLDERVEALANRIKTVPINQLAMQKMVINQYMETSGITQMQRLSTIFDGISRHSPEGIQFQKRVEEKGWKEAVRERDQGLYDWSKKKKFD